MTSIELSEIVRNSFVDGPGIRSVAFLKGCPIRCPWCHNPETQVIKPELMFDESKCISCDSCAAACPAGAVVALGSGRIDRARCTDPGACARCVEACPTVALSLVGRRLTPAKLVEELAKDEAFFVNSHGGVTFSGGEPLMQAAAVTEALRLSKSRGFHVALDTCGVAPWAVFESVHPFVDLYLWDIKHTSSKELQSELALQNARRIAEMGGHMWIRIPLVPGVNDSDEELTNIARAVESLGSAVLNIQVLPFHRMGDVKYHKLGRTWSMQEVPDMSIERAEKCREFLSAQLRRPVAIGGTSMA